MYVKLEPNDPLYNFKYRNWWINEFNSVHGSVSLSISNKIGFRKLLSFARLISIVSVEEVYNIVNHIHFKEARYRMSPFQRVLSVNNELNSLNLLISMFNDCLSQYDTAYEDDIIALKAVKTTLDGFEEKILRPFSNSRNAIIQIAGEKEIILFYLRLVNMAIDILQNSCTEDSLRGKCFIVAEIYSQIKNTNNNSILYEYAKSLYALVRHGTL